MSWLKNLMDKIRHTMTSLQEKRAAEQVEDPAVKQINSREIWQGVPKRLRPGHRRYYGRSPWPQIIRNETAQRWAKEGRQPKNRIAVTR